MDNYFQVLGLSDAELAKVDPVEMNLLVAKSIPSLANLDIPRYQATIERWCEPIQNGHPKMRTIAMIPYVFLIVAIFGCSATVTSTQMKVHHSSLYERNDMNAGKIVVNFFYSDIDRRISRMLKAEESKELLEMIEKAIEGVVPIPALREGISHPAAQVFIYISNQVTNNAVRVQIFKHVAYWIVIDDMEYTVPPDKHAHIFKFIDQMESGG